jgi:hypothetical protein
VPSTSSCFQKIENGRIFASPVVPPYITTRAPGRAMSSALANVSPPAESITSVGPPPLCARTSFDQFSLVL